MVDNLNISVPEVQGVQQLIEELKRVDADHLKFLRKEIITEIKPLYMMIKQSIPNSAPLSGMNHGGRTTWNQPTRVVGKVSYRTRAGKNSLVSIRTTSAAVEMADMAGRKGQFDVGRRGGNAGLSAEYMIAGRKRRHVLNGQGKAMVRGLNSRAGRGASRYIWPSIEAQLPFVRDRVRKILDNYAAMVSRKLM